MTKTNKMRNKDYFHLAKQSLKSRKKSTRTTVAGISFGLILMLPVLYFSFAFYLDFNSKINSIPMVSMFNVSTTVNESTDFYSAEDYNGYMIRGTKTVDEMLATAKHKDVVYFNKNYFNNYTAQYIQFSVNGRSSIPLSSSLVDSISNGNGDIIIGGSGQGNSGLLALDYDMSHGKLANDSMIEFLKEKHNTQLIATGNNFTSTTKGKGELVLSERYASKNSIKVGDKISMTYEGMINGRIDSFSIDNDSNPDNYFDYEASTSDNDHTTYTLPFMQNFTVVGLLADEYYNGLSTAKDADMFITTASYIDESGKRLAPSSKMQTHTQKDSNGGSNVSNYTLLTYSTDYYTLCDTAAANGQMAMLHGITSGIGENQGNFYRNNLASTSQERLLRVQFNNYSEAGKADKLLAGKMTAQYKDADDTTYSNDLFSSYKIMNMVGTIVISVFMVFGGVILFATMINLYNSIQYSVESRRNYMGMLRAVGAKDNILHRMYFTEVILIFLKSLPWIAIIGGGICVGVKFAIDAIFKYISEMMGMVLSLSFWYIPAVFALLFAFAFLVGIIYSRVCCKPLTKKGILTLLKEDR